jgi:hypothetical protein
MPGVIQRKFRFPMLEKAFRRSANRPKNLKRKGKSGGADDAVT